MPYNLRAEQVLDSFNTGQVFTFINSNPGARQNYIKRKTRLSNGVFDSALRKLEHFEYIVVVRSLGEVRCYTAYYYEVHRKEIERPAEARERRYAAPRAAATA